MTVQLKTNKIWFPWLIHFHETTEMICPIKSSVFVFLLTYIIYSITIFFFFKFEGSLFLLLSKRTFYNSLSLDLSVHIQPPLFN